MKYKRLITRFNYSRIINVVGIASLHINITFNVTIFTVMPVLERPVFDESTLMGKAMPRRTPVCQLPLSSRKHASTLGFRLPPWHP